MKKFIYRITYIAIFILLTANISTAQYLGINKATTTPSNCAADGTLSVETTVNPNGATVTGVYYSIESTVPGATRSETQNVSDPYKYTFVGLPSGTHKLIVKVLLSTTQQLRKEQQFTIGGEYKQMSAAAYEYVASTITCDSTGVAYVRVMGGKGTTSVTISNYTGSAIVSPIGRSYKKSENSGSYKDYYFYDLPSGNYEFRVQDDCFTIYKTLTVNTVDLAPSFLFGSYVPENKNICEFDVTIVTRASLLGIPNAVTLDSYYNNSNYFFFQFSFSGHTSPILPIGTLHRVPTELTKNLNIDGATITIFDACQNVIKTLTASKTNRHYLDEFIYPLDNTTSSCDSVYILTRLDYTGGQYRVLFGGTAITDWKDITSQKLTFKPHVPLKDIYEPHNPLKQYSVEIKNQCGGTYSSQPLRILHPSYNISNHLSRAEFNCIPNNTFNYLANIHNGYYGVICLPATYTLENVSTGQTYSTSITTRGVMVPIKNIPYGTYKITISGADGYVSPSSTTTFNKPAPRISDAQVSASTCVGENMGHFILHNITKGTRIQLISSPPGTSYYYDFTTYSSGNQNIGPNNHQYGKPGDYVFKVTDTCGIEYNIPATLKNVFKVTKFDLTKGTEDCDGMDIHTDGAITLADNPITRCYFMVTKYPAGYIPPTHMSLAGTPLRLTVPGEYTIGIYWHNSFNAGRDCPLQEKKIYYDGAGVQFDLNASLAYVCPNASDNEGHILIQAARGKAPYTYYVSNEGDGGDGVADNPSRYIVKNNTGDFTTTNFQKGTTYDVTIIDDCKSTIVQKFKIGDLNEVRLAYAEKSLVCEGEAIEFKAMALPNPTFKWYKPDNTLFSTLQAPIIPSATLADAGTYKVDITTSLCTSQTVTLDVPIAVQPPPTLTLTEGIANQDICRYSAMTDIVYTWGGSATDVVITGHVIPPYTKNMAAKTITFSSNNIAYTPTFTITTVGGCSSASADVKITIHTPPGAYPVSEASTNQAICLGAPIATITYNHQGPTNNISVVGLPPGVTGVYAFNALKIAGTPTSAGAYTYTITASTTNPNNPCSSTQYTGTIIVDTKDVLTLTSAAGTDNQTACLFGSSIDITPIVYTWGGTATDVTVTGLPVGRYTKNTTNKTVTIRSYQTSISLGTTNYTITTVGCSSTPVTLTGSITAVQRPTTPTLPTQYICSGQPVSVTIPNTKAGYIYDLYTDNWLDTDDQKISPSNGASVTLTGTLASTTTRHVAIRVTDTNGCWADKKIVTVDVHPLPATPSLSASPICRGDNTIINVAASSSSNSYSIYDAATGGTLMAGPVTGNGATLDINCGIVTGLPKVLYVDIVTENGCTFAREPITITERETLDTYPDIRILACPQNTINLSKYIDTLDFISVAWSTPPANNVSIQPNGTINNATMLVPGNTYSYFYSVTNSCLPIKNGVLYLTVPKYGTIGNIHDKITICYENASSIQLNQIMAIEANGTWNSTLSAANKHLKISTTAPYAGGAIFNGLAAWGDTAIPTNSDGNKEIAITFTPSAGSCFAAYTYSITIILTPNITN